MHGLMFLIGAVSAAQVSPIAKVLQLLGDLEAKIVADGEAQQKIYEKFTDHCSDESKNLQFSIKTSQGDAERHSAAIDDSAAQNQGYETRIGDLGSASASNEAQLKEAAGIRKKEHEDFLAADADLAETNNMLSRAIAIIEKEMHGGSSLLQDDTGMQQRVAQALGSIVAAAGVNSEDKLKVQALLQADDEQPTGAPDAAAFDNQSGGILSTLEDMLEKAQEQQSADQKDEMTAAHNFALLEQGLKDAIATAAQELADAKKGKAGAEEAQAAAEGELATSTKEIADDQKTLKDLQHECMSTAESYEQESKERSGELGALAAAKKILEEKTGGAADRAYGLVDTSFVQLSSRSRSGMRATDNVVTLLRSIAKKTGATELAQLASRVRATAATNSDPFAKVKGMLQGMVEKLVKEAADEAGHKAFCDKEMSETKAKKEDMSDELDDLSTKMDKFAANIAKLAEDVAQTQEELSEMAGAQREADQMRQAQKDAWAAAKSDFAQGLEGVQMALQVLRDYYAQKDDGEALMQTTKATGSSTGIIGMLEVAESDFTQMLAEGEAAEDQAISEYDTLTQDNRQSKAEKSTAVTYMEKDSKSNKALLADTRDDLGVSQEEADAIMEYWTKLQPQCVAKPEPYEERKARREQEIEGLKQALEILESESASATAFLAVRA